MYHIRLYNAIAKEGLALLDADDFTIREEAPEGILLRSQDLNQTELPASLLAIARAGAGTNNIPVADCAEKGIVVFNTPGANSNAVKELVIAALIIASRHLATAAKWVQRLEGDDLHSQVEAGKKQFKGTELVGKTIGIVGMGAIGSRIARDCVSLGMRILAFDPYFKGDAAWKHSASIVRVDDLEDLVSQSDFITLHVPYNKGNHHLIHAQLLAQAKPNAVLLNFSRSDLVDTEALLSALNEDRMQSYLTDFAEPRLMHHPKVVVFPHLGASTEEAEINCAIMAAESLRDYLLTGDITNSVNFPDVQLPMRSPLRLCIFNRNVTNMIGTISTALADRNINIEHIVNRSQGDFAYTMVDIGREAEEDLQSAIDYLHAQEGIIRIRLLTNGVE